MDTNQVFHLKLCGQSSQDQPTEAAGSQPCSPSSRAESSTVSTAQRCFSSFPGPGRRLHGAVHRAPLASVLGELSHEPVDWAGLPMGHTPHVLLTCHPREDQVRKPQGQGHEPTCKVPRSSLRCAAFPGGTNPARAGSCNGLEATWDSQKLPLPFGGFNETSFISPTSRNHAVFGRPTVFTLCVKAEPPFRAAGAILLEASLSPSPSRKGCAWQKGSGFRGPPVSPSWSCLRSSPRLICASSLGSHPESTTFTNLLEEKRTKTVFPQRRGQKAGEEY